MNKLQHLLLKLGEESNEIAIAIMEDGAFSGVSKKLTNTSEINMEVNDLKTIIQLLNQEYGFRFNPIQSIYHSIFKNENKDKDMFFWMKYTAEKAINVSKITSKSIQFGLNEKHADLSMDNKDRLCCSLRDVFVGIDQLTDLFGLGFKEDQPHIENKIIKIKKYLEYSTELGCISESPVPKSQIPQYIMIIPDEYHFTSIKEEPNTVICLPMKA